jgi:hypothetical protein
MKFPEPEETHPKRSEAEKITGQAQGPVKTGNPASRLEAWAPRTRTLD